MANNRPLPMDPPHITEFASDRYFEKLGQLNAQQQQQQQQHPNASVAFPPSQFILPLRESKTADYGSVKQPAPKREKSGLFGLRSKVTLAIHRSSHAAAPEHSISQPQSHPSVVVPIAAPRKSIPFDQSFLGLPNELQIQILSLLPLTDILNLRLASKSWHTLITLHETPIVRYHLDHHIPAYAIRLYPVTSPAEINFHYLCGLWHRLHVAAKLASLMCEWITKEIFLRKTDVQRQGFAPQRERMRRRLIPILFTTFHFFETYRKLHLEYIAKNGHGLQWEPYTQNPIEAQIMSMYDDRTLLRVHEAFPLVISSFCRQLRPPTYVGRVEKAMRGYIHDKPSDDVHVAILCIGGLRQVERLWEKKGYNNRRGAVDEWFNGLTKASVPIETTPKQRRGIMGIGFGRKKSGLESNTYTFSTSNNLKRTRSASGSMDDNYPPEFSNWVFNTSLAAGAPMSPLSHYHAQQILNDLPVLQQIWVATAEALVLERGIVERTQDIKRGQQMMLDLIREDCVDDEDEWWYGRNNPDSVRPPPGANEDDEDVL
ncbi:hypothetical protein HJFPF1_01431 [Paramyrothecium foliicola]|nr:hypothetical protein HJFPF1_01431 [Paramyrothecium foliicola]